MLPPEEGNAKLGVSGSISSSFNSPAETLHVRFTDIPITSNK